jgi:hypothetical protein
LEAKCCKPISYTDCIEKNSCAEPWYTLYIIGSIITGIFVCCCCCLFAGNRKASSEEVPSKRYRVFVVEE